MQELSDKAVSPYAMDEKDAADFIGVSQKTLQTWRSRRISGWPGNASATAGLICRSSLIRGSCGRDVDIPDKFSLVA